MSTENKVVWSEGMFLRPQHFQQHDRYLNQLVRSRTAELRPYPWGLAEIEINRELLTTGRFALIRCRGVLEDGTPFAIPAHADPPAPLEFAGPLTEKIVYLILPVRQPGVPEIVSDQRDGAIARYVASEHQIADAVVGSDSTAGIRIGKHAFRYALETQDRQGYISLPVARIAEVRADRNVVLDETFIPPALVCATSPVLEAFIAEVQGLLHHRGEALAARVAGSAGQGAAEIADFLLLQLVNRVEPLLAHLMTLAGLHPESLYRVLVSLAGELATFMGKSKRPGVYPRYLHTDLRASFAPVMAEIRQFLSAVLEQSAIAIPLEERKQHNLYVGRIADPTLIRTAEFVLAVTADAPTESLRRNLPQRITISDTSQILELVNAAVSGIAIRPMQAPPRQIPLHASATYFELDRSSNRSRGYWRQVASAGAIALHVGADIPNLRLQLWAIRG